MRRGGIAAVLTAGSLVAAAGAVAYSDGPVGAEKEPAAHVNANGNPISGNLNFDPASVTVAVRDIVAWTNTDDAVPHTATEENGLWDLSGDYGDPAGQFRGFGPGETVSRDFEAGTFNYFCEVHTEMVGVVKVPVTLRPRKRLIARWGSSPLPADQAYDVQRRVTRTGRQARRTTKWRTVLEGVVRRRVAFGYGRRNVTEIAFRARVRDTSRPGAASGWSPRASHEID